MGINGGITRLASALVICCGLGLTLSPAPAASERPHIILIMADDLGLEGLGCYGGESYQTPNLDRLAVEGLRFTHAYAQPLCTPTRVQLMTGKYNHRNWLYFGILDPKERTFGHLLQDAGYQTCIAGKWQLQSYDPPDYPGAEARRGTGMHPKDAGFDDYSLFHALHTEDKGSRYANPTCLENGELKGPADGAYGEDIWADFIIDFIEKNKDGDQPMFVYYPMALPHWPMNPTPDSEDWQDPGKRRNEDVKYFPDMVEYMDKVVGRLVDRVDALGLGENTLILFYSDNGTDQRITSRMAGREVRGGKGLPTDAGIRVPLIARWTGKIEAGTTCSDLIDSSDFLPTLADIAQAKIPAGWHTDGISFAPQLTGKPGTPRDWAFFWYDPRPGWDKDKFTRHVFALDKRYKLYDDGRFYDLETDLLEERPLAESSVLTDPQAAARQKLREAIDAMMAPPHRR